MRIDLIDRNGNITEHEVLGQPFDGQRTLCGLALDGRHKQNAAGNRCCKRCQRLLAQREQHK